MNPHFKVRRSKAKSLGLPVPQPLLPLTGLSNMLAEAYSNNNGPREAIECTDNVYDDALEQNRTRNALMLCLCWILKLMMILEYD